jgi:invasion protein IalB
LRSRGAHAARHCERDAKHGDWQVALVCRQAETHASPCACAVEINAKRAKSHAKTTLRMSSPK